MWVRLTENINAVFRQGDIVRVRDVKSSGDSLPTTAVAEVS